MHKCSNKDVHDINTTYSQEIGHVSLVVFRATVVVLNAYHQHVSAITSMTVMTAVMRMPSAVRFILLWKKNLCAQNVTIRGSEQNVTL